MHYTLFGDRVDGTYAGIDASHAHLNVPATFVWARGMETAPVQVRFDRPAGWRVATQMVPTADSAVFTAPDLQYFMDSPAEVGPWDVREWTVQGSGGRPSTVRLVVHHTGTAEELDRGRQNAANDEATFRSIDSRKRAAKLGSRAEDIAVAAARVLAARARRDQARAVADRMVVKAPGAGQILEIKFRVGEYYTPQGTEPLLVMGDTRIMRVRMDVDERDISKVQVGAKTYAVADGFPGQTFAGQVVEIGHHMGRKNIRTDEPTERIDTKILEVLIQLEAPGPLVPGLRGLSYV